MRRLIVTRDDFGVDMARPRNGPPQRDVTKPGRRRWTSSARCARTRTAAARGRRLEGPWVVSLTPTDRATLEGIAARCPALAAAVETQVALMHSEPGAPSAAPPFGEPSGPW